MYEFGCGPPGLGANGANIAEKLQLCSSCHGEAGTPVKPDIPIIWGQNEYYIYTELKRQSRPSGK